MAGRRVLLVEGRDDEHVMKHICGNRGIAELDEIKSHGGVTALLESFPVRLKESDTEALGVVLDADTDIGARWRSVASHLERAGFAGVPMAPQKGGAILEPPPKTLLPRVGVWVMPDNEASGILEDFLRFLVPPDSNLFAHVTESVATIPEEERRFQAVDTPKATIHTWLAWQKEPGKALGTAITARYLDLLVQEVDVLADWLRRLFFFDG